MHHLFKTITFILIFSISGTGFAQTFAEIEAKLKTVDYANAHKELLPLIEKGNAEAQNLLGELYQGRHYDDFERSMIETEKWYKLAARQNLVKAQFNLSYLYKRVADSIYMLGLWRIPSDYEMSEDLKQDVVEVKEIWRRLAIEQGSKEVKSDTNMLSKFRPKEGNEIYKEAFKWFKKLADQNHAEGQYNVCYLYADGLGVKKDFNKAAKWCELADKQNYEEAKYMLQYIRETQKLCSDKDKVEEYKKQHPFFNKPDC